MGLGGPVWHCSVATLDLWTPVRIREVVAREVLAERGDAQLGEWIQDRPKAFHLRRRLSQDEQSRIGDAIDLRGTSEALARFEAAKPFLPKAVIALALEELGEFPELIRSAQ